MSASADEIQRLIPHRPPMLLVDEIVAREGGRIVCRKHFRADEYFFAGHYPDHPLVPGVILCEAGMQAGTLLVALLLEDAAADAGDESATAPPAGVPVATRIQDVRFKRMVVPEDTIEMEITLDEQLANAYFLTAKVTCEGRLAARFQFACALVET